MSLTTQITRSKPFYVVAGAGDLAVKYARVDGKPVAKPVIERAELERWVAAGNDERGAA